MSDGDLETARRCSGHQPEERRGSGCVDYEIALTLVAKQRLARLATKEKIADELESRSRVILERLGVMSVVDASAVTGIVAG